jgi:hypothetical protein
MSDKRVGYWLHDHEDTAFLNSLPGESNVLAMRGTYSEVKVDPRSVMKIENQGSVGSCQGHALSSCVELCYYIATGDLTRQLSRAYAYYETQRIDNISGDRGSTISGGIKARNNARNSPRRTLQIHGPIRCSTAGELGGN